MEFKEGIKVIISSVKVFILWCTVQYIDIITDIFLYLFAVAPYKKVAFLTLFLVDFCKFFLTSDVTSVLQHLIPAV